MQKNYYVILGVGSGATLEEIKSAFRHRALELHPDRSGLGDRPFQELQEAYGVLSDHQRRLNYDARRQPLAERRHPWGPSAEPLVDPRVEAEPFKQSHEAWSPRQIAVDKSFDHYAPSFDEIFHRLWTNFEDLSRPKAEQLESLTVEVMVSPAEAMRGGCVRMRIPGKATCPICGGQGAVGLNECWRCEGQGARTAAYPLDVTFPPLLRDGHVVRISLARFGIENFYLTIIFRVVADD
jgi:DnaJ-class molecular chaperone